MNLNKKVTTYDGTVALRVNCRYIRGQCYIKNKQCFFIDGQWNRVNNGKIIFDHETRNWIKKAQGVLRQGIVGFKTNGDIEFGYYTPNPLKNVTIGVTNLNNVQSGHDCISEEIALKLGLKESLIDGQFYQYDILNKEQVNVLNTKIVPQRNSTYRFPFEYGSERMIPEFTTVFNRYFIPQVPLKHVHRLKFLNKYKWGIEFETAKGTITERFLWPNGLIACRDGSITGFEYVTIPLQKKNGIEAIYNSTMLLNKYAEISYNNSLHIHIGNYPVTMKSVIAIYRLGTRIQKEIFSMFPAYYQDTSIFKGKSYCSPLVNISSSMANYEATFLKLYQQISGGYEFEGFNKAEHPMDRSGRHKWNINPRYKYLNIIPLLFGTKQTLEFRVHTPTFNAQKVIYWLFIVIAILEFAQKYRDDLISKSITIDTSLESIIISHYNNDADLVASLLNYIKLRKSWFKSGLDPDGRGEIQLDSTIDLERII